MKDSIERLENQIEELTKKNPELEIALNLAEGELAMAISANQKAANGIYAKKPEKLPEELEKRQIESTKIYDEKAGVVAELKQQLKTNQEKLAELQSTLTKALRAPSANEETLRSLETQIKNKHAQQDEALMAAAAIDVRMANNPPLPFKYIERSQLPQMRGRAPFISKEDLKNSIKALDTEIAALEKQIPMLEADLKKLYTKDIDLKARVSQLTQSIEQTKIDQKADFFLVRMYRGIFGSPTLKKKENELNPIKQQSAMHQAQIKTTETQLTSTKQTITDLKSTRETQKNELDKRSHSELTAERCKLMDHAERLGHEIEGLEQAKKQLSITTTPPEKESSQDITPTTKTWKEKLVSVFKGTSSKNESSKENEAPLAKPPTFGR